MEIEFKAQRIDNKEWVYGYFIKNKNGECYIKDTDYNVTNGKNNLIPYEVIPETVCQYIGVKDKNGKKVYDNDKVKLHQFLFDGNEIENELTGYVSYHKNTACYCISQIENNFYEKNTGYKKGEGQEPICNLYGLHEESFEVIGNKFD